MTVISTTIHVASDGTVSVADKLPPGDYAATVTVARSLRRPGKAFIMEDFPIDDGPWDDSISLRREDMYRGDGRPTSF